MAEPEKMRKRRRRGARVEAEVAVIVAVVLGGTLAALQLQETVSRWSQVPESLFVVAHLIAVVLVTGAVTERVRTGLLCGVMAAIAQFLTLLGVYTYSYGITVAILVLPLQSLRVLTYPAAGVVGGYIGHLVARSAKPSRRVRHVGR